ncbi:MAG TPA: hypothetical protein VFZ00_17195 [Solirubrobacter sp.]|nr:hypothetical protein [Solirubrobacter sp.]
MLPALRLVLPTLTVLLACAPAAQAAKKLSVPIAAEGQVSVAVATKAKGVKVKSAPAGVTVAGGVKKGRLAVAVVRPRGVAATGKVTFTLKSKVKGVKTFAAALDGGKAGAACKDLASLLSKRLKGSADMKALSPILAAKLCGKAAPADAAAVLQRLGLGAPPIKQGTLAPPPSRPGTNPSAGRPAATPTPSPTPAVERPCVNGLDDDGDGQTDWEDPGCEHAGDKSETGEVPVSAACAAEAAIAMGEDPTEFGIGINGACGSFYSVEIDLPPGVQSCTANNGYKCEVHDPIADTWISVDQPERDMVDIGLVLKGPVQCEKPYTIAFWRRSGEVAELRTKVANCRNEPAPPPKCSNGKDDDGDGMIDSRDFAGASDPDPGCTSPADTSENSELPIPDWCDVQVGIFGNNLRLPGMQINVCSVIKGVWFKPPGTPEGCVFVVGGNDPAECDVKGGVGRATFPLTNMQVRLATPIAADVTCAPVTVALEGENDVVYAERVAFC